MNEKVKFYILTFIRYLGDSFFYPFFALYLHTKENIGESKIGILIALSPFIGLIANPIFSKLSKNYKTLKNVLGIIGIIEAIIIVVLLKCNSFYTLLIFTILLALVGSSHYGLFDSLITIYATENKMNFSKIRVWGSIAYVFGTAIGGEIIEKMNYDFSFILCSVFFILSSILYFSVKPIYNNIKKEEKRSYKEVLTNKKFLSYLVFYMLLYGVMKTSNNYYSLLLESRGLSESVFGYNYTMFVLVEVILLFVFNKYNKKLNFQKLLFISSLFTAIMTFVNGSNLPSYVIIAISALRGIAWSIILHISNKVVVNLLGIKNTTLGTMALDLTYSMIVILCNSMGGFIIEDSGYNIFYTLLGVLATIDLIYYLLVVRKNICVNDEIETGEVTE